MRAPLAVLVALIGCPAFAATDAVDRANELAYFDGFQDGDNGGTGWGGGWEFTDLQDTGGLTLATSTNNGDGDTDGDGDIDTANVAWEIFVGGGDKAVVRRDFDGDLAVGQVFSANLDAVPHPDPYAAGVQLADGFNVCFDFRWNGDDEEFEVVDGAGFFVFPLQTTDEGIHLEYELTGADTYTLRVNRLGGPVVHRNGQKIDGCVPEAAVFFIDGDSGTRRLFFNRIRIPEPAATAAASIAFAALAAARTTKQP